MSVRFVRYGLTKNIGNYESERIDVEVEREPEEDFDACVKRARDLCSQALADTDSVRKKSRVKKALRNGDIDTLRELLESDFG